MFPKIRFFSTISSACLAFLLATHTFATPIVWVASFDEDPDDFNTGSVSIIDVANSYSVSLVNTDFIDPAVVSVPESDRVYVTDFSDDLIYVLDSETYASIATFSVVNDGEIVTTSGKGYVSGRFNQNDKVVRIFDTGDGAVLGTIPVNSFVYYMAVAPNDGGVFAYSGNELYFISTTTDTVQNVISLDGGGDLVVSPDGNTIYAADYSNAQIHVVDVATQSVTGNIPVGANPVGMGILPDGSKLYVANSGGDSVSVVDTATSLVVATTTLSANSAPFDVAISPDGLHAYAANTYLSTTGATEVAVIDTTTDTLITAVSVPNAYYSFSIGVVDRGFTKTGSNVILSPITAVDLTFSSVTSGGDTSITTSTPPVLPEGFQLNNDSLAFDISTTASFSGVVEVCVNYTDETLENLLKLLHEEGGIWVDVTTSLDTVNNIICGDVTSFSLFAVAIREYVPISIDIKPNSPQNTINLGSNGNIPVAIMGSETLDVSQIDPLSVELASAPVQLRGNGTSQTSQSDVNGDGYTDLTVHIDTEALELAEEEVATLVAYLLDGTKLQGTDMVNIVP